MKLPAGLALASLVGAAGCMADPAAPAKIEIGASFSLRAGASAQTRDGLLQIGFERVSADSRCPKGEQCIWAGDATVRVWLKHAGGPIEIGELHAAEGEQQRLHSRGHELRLLRLAPYPIAGKTIASGDYEATLTLKPSAEADSVR